MGTILKADDFGFVAKTSGASTISFLNATSGVQTGGLALNATAGVAAVYSAGRAFISEFTGDGALVEVYDLSTGKSVGSVAFPLTVGSILGNPKSTAIYVSAGATERGDVTY